MQKNFPSDILAEKISKLAEIFPECITEKRDDNGNIFRAVNFDLLKNILEENIPDAPEFYDFAWVGKNLARATAYAPTNKTLRPVIADSSNFNTTQNLYIEGDNLDVLKILQRSYFAKVKLIYIDPPYNTGHDFIYNDNFQMSEEDFAAETDMFDEAGNKNFRENKESNPRLHSDWCSMIFARLLVARNLLADDGVIFISIDDNEQANLKKICDEVFGEKNFINIVTVKTKIAGVSGSSEGKILKDATEFILIYAKNKSEFQLNPTYIKTKLSNKMNMYKAEGKSWKYTSIITKLDGKILLKTDSQRGMKFFGYKNLETKSVSAFARENNLPEEEVYNFYADKIFRTTNAQSSIRQTVINEMNLYNYPIISCEYSPIKGKNEGKPIEILYKNSNYGQLNMVMFLSDVVEKIDGVYYHLDKVSSLWDDIDYNNLTKEGDIVFPNGKKPLKMLKRILELATDKNSIVLDFFSGSATTAHAVMELNAEDGGRRQFIMVQLPEMCREDSEAAKAGYSNICEIGKERIRRAGQKIKESAPLVTQELDTGFRVLKLDSTNYKNVFIKPKNLTQEMLEDAEENIKADRSAADLLFGVLIEIGVELNKSYGAEEFSGATIHNYNGGEILACFDKNISLEVVKHIAQKNPEKIFFRDASFATDSDRMNAMAILEYYKLKSKTKII